MPRNASSSSRARSTKKKTPAMSAAPTPAQPPMPVRRQPLFSRPPVILGILGTMIVAAIYLWVVQPAPSYDTGGSNQKMEKKADLNTVSGLISHVSTLIAVKTDEVPTVYSVTDAAAFTEAWPAASAVKEGDKVLEWSDKTVIYSPKDDKIVAVLPALDYQPEPKEPEVLVSEDGVSIEIRNGSGVAGAAARMQRNLRDQNFIIDLIGDARTRINEGGSIIIDFTNGGAPNALTLLQGATSATIAALPSTEPVSNSDFLIIIGNE